MDLCSDIQDQLDEPEDLTSIGTRKGDWDLRRGIQDQLDEQCR